MSVASKMQFSNEEIFNEFVRLEDMEPAEQISVWTGHTVKNGIDPFKVVYPFNRSTGKGFECMNCQHIDMKTAHQSESRRLYHWPCNKHHNILEGYRGLERVLTMGRAHNIFTQGGSKSSQPLASRPIA